MHLRSANIAGVDPALHAALANGAVAVTPNRRLARSLQRSFAAVAESQGHRVWATPTILPYVSWLETLWLEALATDAIRDPRQLLTPAQAVYTWQRVVAADGAGSAALIDARGAANLAAEAWELLHGWSAGGESWRGWPAAALGEDPACFVRWADAYASALATTRAFDLAQLAGVLVRHAPRLVGLRGRTVLLAGFLELSPQQLRLVDALTASGARIERVDTLPEAGGVAHRASAATARDELACALAWARTQISSGDGVVGIVVEDLSVRRAEARVLAEEILCPALQWPGRESEPRPYNISLGDRIADVALVAAALELIALGTAPLPLERAAAVLRSSYLDGARATWTRRASLEARWLDEGRDEIALRDAIAALRRVDEALARRWEHASATARLPASSSPRGWTEAWRDWLIALGWPGDAPLSSAEYQARVAWDKLLIDFGGLAAVETRLARNEAVALLQALAAETVFQPEAPEASIQILGLLEAQGLAFDALWVAGLSAERWPPAPQPNALLPAFWQRERNVPRSSAAREIAYARALTERYLRAAPRVVLSHPSERDQYDCAPSALICDLPALAVAACTVPRTAAEAIHAAAPVFESVVDDVAPPLATAGRVSGGAGLFEKQSECPFRAVTIHRLAADRWPVVAAGLSAIERGNFLHRVFAEFWRDLRDQNALIGLSPDALAARVDAAVANAMASGAIPASRRRALPPLVLALEADRLSRLAREWLERIERSRPSFEVLYSELDLRLSLGGFDVRLRLDRVDRLSDGAIAIIDYKTGRAVPPAKWFDPRPQAPQLALYALAWRAGFPSRPVRAVAYAQVKRGELKLLGLAADDTIWPGVPAPSSVNRADWSDVESHWQESLSALAGEISRGHAAVAPRDSETCRRCGLHAFCRIGALASEERSAPSDDE
jgi:probable DNA repair protein